MTNRRVLGLDIGVTSVGWGVIDLDDSLFADAGVRLFTEADAENNLKRRTRRSGRRIKARRTNRLSDLRKVLKSLGIIDETFNYLPQPVLIRCRAVREKVSNEELATCLFHICKHRGNHLETIEDDAAKIKDNETTKKQLHENDLKLSQGFFVCDIQAEQLALNGKYRGHTNTFRTKQYIAEVEAILTQTELSLENQKLICEIIGRRRHFSEGPGGPKSPTKYGRYRTFGEDPIDLIEQMRGHCSVYPNELRAPKNSFSAEKFNLLNDLNNLNIDGRKITLEEKEEILQIIKSKGSITPLGICKVFDVNEELVGGFRIDKSDKPIITEFKGYKKIRNALKEIEAEWIYELEELMDQIMDILTSTKVVEERQIKLTKLSERLTVEIVNSLSQISGVSEYHSLSLKAIKELNNELLVTSKNQQQILAENNLLHQGAQAQKGAKKIRFDEEAVLSPVAKQAHREAIKVINQLRQHYGEFESIVIETTRAKNSQEEKKNEQDRQKYFEDLNKQSKEIIGDKKVPKDTPTKIRLYNEQRCKCIYTGETIDLVRLMEDPHAYEIDHIIPISISLDDSINNKVLVTHRANQIKGNRTPFQVFNQQGFGGYSFEEYKSAIISNPQLRRNKKKTAYLLFDRDITKYDVMKEFINRNLVDTSYANRLVLNTLQDYFRVNQINTKVFTVKGQATAAFRKRIQLDKDREDGYYHHAIDALIVAAISRNKVLDKALSHVELINSMIHFKETGELYDPKTDDKLYLEESYINFIKRLYEIKINKFSWKVDRKPNRQISDETIYSTRLINESNRVVKKYKDIYDPKFTNLALDIQEQGQEKLIDKYLMAKHDPRTFDKLQQIVNNYINEYGKLEKNGKVNPLAIYYQQHGPIRKYAKHNNGPVITSIAYLEDTLGNHIDISKNYKVGEDKKVVLLQVSPYRTDFYQTEDGIYRFVTVRYSNLKYRKSSNSFVIDPIWYQQQLTNKKIKDNSQFLFSMNRNDIIEIESEKDKQMYRFVGTNNDRTNAIEIKPLHIYEKKQIIKAVGKSMHSIAKYHINAIGTLYEIKKEVLKLEISCDKI
jgi:CRISPR-associated endonuclease Csn1